eukprot:CAMPEP_0197534226 /NCGR_PEP_ID=MMETSP1318-20131121/46387_1 /TAXON_ID=552666 /ORGANISM="Partenskyella glossopodia, Strain RCC365" /LENGTH=233 /DNA_ID=CAMNT_0043091415 /DNA_START=35 /DNA_END=736 /DNA_ORIENTATION=-
MGGRQCKPVVEPREAGRSLRPDQIEDVKTKFRELSAAGNLKSSITKDDLTKWLALEFLPKTHPFIIDRFYQLFDIDSNGTIEFAEFLVLAYLLVYGPEHHRLQLVFNLYDLDGTGKLTRKNFQKISSALVKIEDAKTSQGENMDKILKPFADLHTSTVFVHSSIDGLGQYMSFNEFRRYAVTSQMVHSILQSIRSGRHAFSREKYAKNNRYGPFEFISSSIGDNRDGDVKMKL